MPNPTDEKATSPVAVESEAEPAVELWQIRRLLTVILSHLLLAGLILWVGVYAALVFPLVFLLTALAVIAAVEHVRKHVTEYVFGVLTVLALLGLYLADRPAWFWRKIEQDLRKYQIPQTQTERTANP